AQVVREAPRLHATARVRVGRLVQHPQHLEAHPLLPSPPAVLLGVVPLRCAHSSSRIEVSPPSPTPCLSPIPIRRWYVSRPGSNLAPTLYGFVPRTYCGERVRLLCPGAEVGDGDPLDICVLSERPIERSEIIVPARVVGGLQVLDRGEADDKIIAVLENDLVW